MKKILVLASLAAMSSGVFAADACGSGTATNITGSTTNFVRTTFAPSCSPNTIVVYTDDGGKLYGGSASTKGQSYYGASTNGGAVQKGGNCNASATACATGATAAAGSGMAAASTYGATN